MEQISARENYIPHAYESLEHTPNITWFMYIMLCFTYINKYFVYFKYNIYEMKYTLKTKTSFSNQIRWINNFKKSEQETIIT